MGQKASSGEEQAAHNTDLYCIMCLKSEFKIAQLSFKIEFQTAVKPVKQYSLFKLQIMILQL